MKRRSMFGAVLIILSLYMIGDMMGLFVNMPGLFQVVLTILLVSVSFSNLWRLDFFGIIMPLTIVAMMYADALKISGNNWMIILAGLLLSTGLKIVFKQPRKQIRYTQEKNRNGNNEYNFTFGDEDDDDDDDYTFDFKEGDYVDADKIRDDARKFAESKKGKKTYTKRSQNDERIDVSSTFSGRTRYVRSDNFTYASLECNFGSLDVYFDEATFNPNGSEIKVECNFGAIKLYLPKDITVDNRVDVTFGSGAEDGNQFVEGGSVVRITGDVNMGSIEIYYN